MWRYGEGVYPVIKGYTWVPYTPTSVQVKESSTTEHISENEEQQPRHTRTVPRVPTITLPKAGTPTKEIRTVAPSQETINFLRTEADWLKSEQKEHFVVFYLDGDGNVTGALRTPGRIDECHVDVSQVVREAQTCSAVSTVLMHNHPSMYTAEPSADDIRSTKLIKEALEAVGCSLSDHYVIASKSGHCIAMYAPPAPPRTSYDYRESRDQALWSAYGGTPYYGRR